MKSHLKCRGAVHTTFFYEIFLIKKDNNSFRIVWAYYHINICETSYGYKQALRNSHLKCRRNCTYKLRWQMEKQSKLAYRFKECRNLYIFSLQHSFYICGCTKILTHLPSTNMQSMVAEWFIVRKGRYQRGNQNPNIEEEQTTQWPKPHWEWTQVLWKGKQFLLYVFTLQNKQEKGYSRW